MISSSSSGKASGCSSFPSQDIKSQLSALFLCAISAFSALTLRSLRLGGKSFPLYHAETQRTQRLVDNGRLQIADCRSQIADCRSQIADRRSQISDLVVSLILNHIP